LARQLDAAVAVRAAVDQVARLNDTIFRLQLQRFEKFFKFIGTSVHVSYGDCSGHSWFVARGLSSVSYLQA
jgi:hypothetical protein